MEHFLCKTKIISGAGAAASLKEVGSKRLFMVTDPYFSTNGQAQRIAGLAGAEATELFDRVTPDPSVELVAEGTSCMRKFQPDTIVALGGGSTIDCAKAMMYFAEGSITLVVIPTTSGSGSEVTNFAILTHDGVKHPLVDEKIQPDLAILDGDLLKELPKSLVADAGFDVLTHAVESFVATGAGVISDALASDAFSAAFALLPASFAGRIEVRQRIHMASAMAGMAFSQSGLGLCHAMAHVLGGMFHVPHGRLNAILLPAVIDCNAHGAAAKYAKLARSAGLGGSADTLGVRNLKNGLVRLRRELNLPQTLAQAGIKPQEIWHRSKEIVCATLADPCCKTNPVLVEGFMVRKILEEVSGRA